MKKQIIPQNQELDRDEDQDDRDLLEITKLAGEMDGIAGTALEKALRIGELLCKCRKRWPTNGMRNVQSWEQWLDRHVPFSVRTAQRYMKIYRSRNDENVVSRLEARWKEIQNGMSESARARANKRRAQKIAQQQLEEETEHGITNAAAFRRVNTIWDRLSKNESEKGKERIASLMVSFLINAYKVDLDNLPDVQIR